MKRKYLFKSFASAPFAAGMALFMAASASVHGADILWSSASGSAWLTGSNWTGSAVPGAADVAQFGANPTGTSGVGINFNGTTNAGSQTNGQKIQELQAIEMLNTRTNNHLIGNSSTTTGATGRLRLLGGTVNGVSNVIIRNNSAGTLTIQNTQNTGTQTMDLWLGNNTENKMVVDGAGNIVITSLIASSSGTTPLTIMGSGTGRVDITNSANTFTGNININGSEVRFTADGSLGNSSNAVIIDGGRFSNAVDTSLTLAGTRNVAVGDGAGTAIVAQGASSIVTITNGIANKSGETGAFEKLGAGTLRLLGNNTYTGATTISAGTLEVRGSLASSGIINNAALIFNNASDQSFANAITGSGSLTKQGAGTLTLSGTNSFLGATNISNGVLEIGGSGSINSSSSIAVAAGAKFVYNSSTALTQAIDLQGSVSSAATLSGTGTINASITLNSLGDVLDPGNSPGIQNFGVSQSWESFTYNWELNDWAAAATAGTNFDQIGITGSLNLTGSSYQLNILSLAANNLSGLVGSGGGVAFSETSRTWTILTTTDGISGFDANQWTLNTSGFTDNDLGSWNLARSGNSLVLSYTAIPEPSVSLIGGLGVLALLRRRRRA